VRPRLTVPVSASAAAVAYLLPSIGDAMSWPQWVMDLSPFEHLAIVPIHPYALQSGLVLAGVALIVTVVGAIGFARRDLVGA
jgi:ABC-2 type transport system permease protein